MVKIYLVRHCEATGNVDGILQGHIDCDISPRGAEQLSYLTKRFENIHIDKAYSSPLRRAFKTVEAAVCGKSLEVIPDEHFAEINCGIIDGVPFERIADIYDNFWDIWKNHPEDFAPKGGETMPEAADRIWDGITALAKDPENENKTIIIGSHGGVLRTVTCRMLYRDFSQLSSTEGSGNTAVSLLTFEDGAFSAGFFNDDSHLPENLKTRSSLLALKE